MKRVVLITEHEPDLQTRKTIEHLCNGLAGDFELVHEEVNAKGLARTMGKVLSVRKLCSDAAIVHAFGYRALKVASFAATGPLLYTPLPEDGSKAVRWVLSAQQHRDVRLICLSSGDHRFMVEHGVPDVVCELVRPGVRMGKGMAGDLQLRMKLGLGQDDVAVLAMGESSSSANHTLALQAASILHFMNPKFRFLFWGRGPEVEAVERLHASWQIRCLVNATRALGCDTPFEQLIPVANVALVTGTSRVAMQPILTCMAGGLPLVGPATYAVSEVLEDHHTALLAPKATPKLLAQRILSLTEDANLQRHLADQARAETYELFSVSRFLDQMRQIYTARAK